RAGLEIQSELAGPEIDLPAENRMLFRIGINVGDVMADVAGLVGDSVNIAARLQTLADPGGICISESVRELVGNKLALTLDDLGSQEVKNIVKPVHVFRVQLDSPKAAGPSLPLSPPSNPSVAVLPFTNMSGDPQQQYFSDGITEDIITELSRFRSLPVVAHNSSAKFGSQSPDIVSLQRSLGVDYVVQGSVRKVRNNVRITAQLVDAHTGLHLWAERYDRSPDEISAALAELVPLI